MNRKDIAVVSEYLKANPFTNFSDVPVKLNGVQYYIRMEDDPAPMGTYHYYAKTQPDSDQYYFIGCYEDFNESD